MNIRTSYEIFRNGMSIYPDLNREEFLELKWIPLSEHEEKMRMVSSVATEQTSKLIIEEIEKLAQTLEEGKTYECWTTGLLISASDWIELKEKLRINYNKKNNDVQNLEFKEPQNDKK